MRSLLFPREFTSFPGHEWYQKSPLTIFMYFQQKNNFEKFLINPRTLHWWPHVMWRANSTWNWFFSSGSWVVKYLLDEFWERDQKFMSGIPIILRYLCKNQMRYLASVSKVFKIKLVWSFRTHIEHMLWVSIGRKVQTPLLGSHESTALERPTKYPHISNIFTSAHFCPQPNVTIKLQWFNGVQVLCSISYRGTGSCIQKIHGSSKNSFFVLL